MDLTNINVENLDSDISQSYFDLLNDNITAISSYKIIKPTRNNHPIGNTNILNNVTNITSLSSVAEYSQRNSQNQNQHQNQNQNQNQNQEHEQEQEQDQEQNQDQEQDSSNDEDDGINVDVLKKMVVRWIKLDDNIKEINKQAKDLKDEKTQIESKILFFMNKNKTEEIQVKDGKLEKKRGEKKEPINEEYIKKCLVKSFDDVEMVDKLAKVILENREITETYKLARKVASKAKPKKN